jgi:hypothetical protein
MFDASAYALAEIDTPPSEPTSHPVAPRVEGDSVRSLWADPALLPLVACATCHRALGGCALEATRAGALPPAIALAACTAMQRMVERAMRAPITSLSATIAFVLLGASRREASRPGDLDAIAETMR